MNLQLQTHDAAMRAACSCSTATISTCCGLMSRLSAGQLHCWKHWTITTILLTSTGTIPATWVRLFPIRYAASHLLTVSLLANGRRSFLATANGRPSLLRVLSSTRLAGRAVGPSLPAPGLPQNSGGKHGEAPVAVCVWGTRNSRHAKRRLTLCRRRSCRRPGPGHRSCRNPPLLLLCVGGGGPTRHTLSGFRCPLSAWPGKSTHCQKCFFEFVCGTFTFVKYFT